MQNQIDVSITPETQAQILDGIASLKTLMPFLVKLSKKERKALQALSDGRKPFAEKSLYYGANNADLNPGTQMLEACNRDMALFTSLNAFETELMQLVEMVRETKHLAGSEVYAVARYIYSLAKMKLAMGVPGMQAIVDDLGKLFEQSGASVPEEDAK